MIEIDTSKYKLEDFALYNRLAGLVKDMIAEDHEEQKFSEEEKMEVCMESVLEFANENNITMENMYDALLFYFVEWLNEK